MTVAAPAPLGDQRLTGRILAYWNGLRAGRPMPAMDEIDPEVLGPDWDHCFVAQVDQDDAPPAMIHVGAALQRASGVLISGQTGFVLDVLDLAERRVRQTCLQRSPVLIQERLPAGPGFEFRARGIFVPLGRRRRTATHVLGSVNGKRCAVAS